MTKRLSSIFLSLILLLGLFTLPARATEGEGFSDELWSNGKYNTTLGDMAGRRLYVYGIVDSFASIPEDSTDGAVILRSDEAAGRLNAALYLYRIFGSEPRGECPFSDVPKQYETAVTWLYEAGATRGIGGNQFGTGSITTYQLLVMLSRFLHWESESESAVYYCAECLNILPPGPKDGTLTNGELYQILSALLDRCRPERCVPARPEMGAPEELSITAVSYEDALCQIRAALYYVPDRIQIEFTQECPEEDVELFLLRFDWFYGDKSLPVIGALDRSFMSPYFLSLYSERRFKLWFSHYADACLARADAQNWLRVYADESYSAALRDFAEQYLLPLRSIPSVYQRVVQAHDLLCALASYEYSELYHKDRPKSHSLLGFIDNRKIVCDGYASTFQWMLLCLDVDSFMVIGKTNGKGHAWNKLMVENAWYNADVCWDDDGIDHSYLLKSDAWFERHEHEFTDELSTTVFASPASYEAGGREAA